MSDATIEQRRNPVIDTLAKQAAELGAAYAAYVDGDDDPDTAHNRLESAQEEHDRAARIAFRAGFQWHPLVMEWQAGLNPFGRKALRDLKNFSGGLTHGLPRKKKPADLWLLVVAHDFTGSNCNPGVKELLNYALQTIESPEWLPDALKAEIERPEELRAELNRRLNASPEAFRKWMARLRLRAPRARRASPTVT